MLAATMPLRIWADALYCTLLAFYATVGAALCISFGEWSSPLDYGSFAVAGLIAGALVTRFVIGCSLSALLIGAGLAPAFLVTGASEFLVTVASRLSPEATVVLCTIAVAFAFMGHRLGSAWRRRQKQQQWGLSLLSTSILVGAYACHFFVLAVADPVSLAPFVLLLLLMLVTTPLATGWLVQSRVSAPVTPAFGISCMTLVPLMLLPNDNWVAVGAGGAIDTVGFLIVASFFTFLFCALGIGLAKRPKEDTDKAPLPIATLVPDVSTIH